MPSRKVDKFSFELFILTGGNFLKKRRGLFLLLISLIVGLVVSACSSNETSSKKEEGESKSTVQGVTDKEILVGTLGPQTGPAAAFDTIRKGLDSYIKYVNENGGVHGRQIKLIAYDDQYQPAKTVQLAKRLVEEDKVFAMTATVCTACTKAALPYYQEQGIPLIMVGSGADVFVNPPSENIIGEYAINYGIEAKVFLDYAVNELGAKKIAIAYQNDDFGKEGFNAVKETVKKYDGVEIVEEVNYLASDVEFSSHAQKLKDANPDAVLAFSSMAPTANLKKAMHKIGLDKPAFLVANPGASNPEVFKLAGEDVWEGTISASPVPLMSMTDNKHLELYKEQVSKYYPKEPLGGATQLGFAAGQVFVEGLERAGKDLTKEKFLEAFYTFENWDGSLFTGITFNKDNHYGITKFFLMQAQNGDYSKLTDTITYDPISGEIEYE